MKKDFSQEFEKKKTTLHLLVRDVVSNNFLFYLEDGPEPYYNVDIAKGFGLELENDKPKSLQLAEYLFGQGLNLNSYREIVKETNIIFGFVDNTPGLEWDDACILCDVDIVDESKTDRKDFKLVRMNLKEIKSKIKNNPDFLSPLEKIGISRLISELGI